MYRFIIRVTRRVPLMEQELHTLREHHSSNLVLLGLVLLDFELSEQCLVDYCFVPFVCFLLSIVLSVLQSSVQQIIVLFRLSVFFCPLYCLSFFFCPLYCLSFRVVFSRLLFCSFCLFSFVHCIVCPSLLVRVVFSRLLFCSFCLFSFVHCIVCPSFVHCIVCPSFDHCIVCPSS